MGNDISPGYVYNTSTQKNVTAANLNQAIGDATLKETAISTKTLKTASSSDEILASDGSGTLKKVTASAIAALASTPPTEVPAGIIANFAVNSTPAGWLPCNGSAILISSYSTLATALYCGDANNATAVWGYKVTDSGGATRATSGTYIVVPDLRGYFVRGFDNGRGIDTGRTWGTTQQDAFQGHRHSSKVIGGTNGFMAGGQYVHQALIGTSTNGAYATDNGVLDPTDDGTNGTPRTGTETRPKNIAIGYYIKY
jgi:microcystin-dependent protein